MINKYNFGVVRTLRKRVGLTMEQLAQESGLTYPTVAAIETNKSLPSMKSLDALAGVLQFSASSLLALAERRMVQIPKGGSKSRSGKKTPGEGTEDQRQVLFDKGRLIRIQANVGEEIHVMKQHNNCHELCYVVSGKMKLTIEGHTYELDANDTILYVFLILVFHESSKNILSS